MNMVDTHEVFKTLIDSGLSETQSEAILYCFNRPLNTLTFYRKLIEAGFSEKQAETLVKVSWEVATNNYQDEY
jgi:hypothetical protein